MLPVVLDAARLRLALVGRGAAAARRLAQLEACGATALTVYSDAPDAVLRAAAGDRLTHRLPRPGELVGIALVYVCDLTHTEAAMLAADASAAGALVNVEDDIALCDVHTPAVVRRGDLLLAISTGGKSPGLAAALKRMLERLFDGAWGERLQALAERRQYWRAHGRTPREVSALTERLLARRGWLPGSARDVA